MTDWDSKVRSFLDRAKADFKRAGRDIRDEGERLLGEVKDPVTQAKLRDGIKEFGSWAKKTAEEVAGLVEVGVKKAEHGFRDAAGRVKDFTNPRGSPTPSASAESSDDGFAPESADPTPPSPPPAPKAKSTKPARKTIGTKKPRTVAAKNAGPKKASGKKKPLGKA